MARYVMTNVKFIRVPHTEHPAVGSMMTIESQHGITFQCREDDLLKFGVDYTKQGVLTLEVTFRSDASGSSLESIKVL